MDIFLEGFSSVSCQVLDIYLYETFVESLKHSTGELKKKLLQYQQLINRHIPYFIALIKWTDKNNDRCEFESIENPFNLVNAEWNIRH